LALRSAAAAAAAAAAALRRRYYYFHFVRLPLPLHLNRQYFIGSNPEAAALQRPIEPVAFLTNFLLAPTSPPLLEALKLERAH